MLVSALRPCARALPRALRSHPLPRPSHRTFTSSPTAPTPPPALTPALTTLTTELDRLAPRFEVDASRITIIRTPADFYSTLKTRILSAQHHIFLSTLYIGKSEHELLSTLATALRRNPHLTVSILTDCLRGTRETPHATTASLLAPLVAEFGARVELRMYHTPNLTGLRKRLVPARLNEGWGLQHMKLYGFDDAVLISGANLSSDYFTNRQDRYHLLDSGAVTAYFRRVHDAVASISYRVLPADTPAGYALEWPSSNPAPEPTADPAAYKAAATKLLAPVLRPAQQQPASDARTLVYPISQFTPVLAPDSSTEHPAVSALLGLLARAERSRWWFTAGYFNPQPTLQALLVSTRGSGARGTVITASPHANGFYGSKGVSGMLPDAYTLLARRFLERVVAAGKGECVELREWKRGVHGVDADAWTYHAKGVWVQLPGEEGVGVTVVGSSNYTKRSYGLDLESGVMVVTRDEGLRERLRGEVEGLVEGSRVVGIEEFQKSERRVSLKVRVAMWLVKVLGGQL